MKPNRNIRKCGTSSDIGVRGEQVVEHYSFVLSARYGFFIYLKQAELESAEVSFEYLKV